MLRLDPKWNETSASLLRRIDAPERRLRQRFTALALVAMAQPAQAAPPKWATTVRPSVSG